MVLLDANKERQRANNEFRKRPREKVAADDEPAADQPHKRFKKNNKEKK